MRQCCCLSPRLFNIYINELAVSRERSAAPGLTLHDSQIRCLLYAYDLGSAVSHSTWVTAEPGPAGAILPDVGPDSQPE